MLPHAFKTLLSLKMISNHILDVIPPKATKYYEIVKLFTA